MAAAEMGVLSGSESDDVFEENDKIRSDGVGGVRVSVGTKE
jgi:hypothetical protein